MANDDGLRLKDEITRLQDKGFMRSSYGGASMSRHGMTDINGSDYTVMVSENIWVMRDDDRIRKVVVIGKDGEASSEFEAHGLYLRMVTNNFDAFKRAVEEIKVYRAIMGAEA